MDEFTFIEKLKKKIPISTRAVLGIGDDAAVLKKLGPGNLVVSTDMLVENVDFVLQGSDKKNAVIPAKAGIKKNGFPIKAFGHDKLESLSPENIGRKALAVNLSDLAAMGAEPVAFVLSIGKPKHVSTRWLERFYDGLLKLAKRYKVDCIGGDFSSARDFSVSITILGLAECPVPRSGAKSGDWIAVTGQLGGSILRHHYAFMPRVREGLFLVKHITPTAMIDISDGLVQDLSHILKASRAGAVLDLDKIPVSRDARKISRGNEAKALTRALSEGEDFELLFTVPPWQKMMLEKLWEKQFPGVPLTWIGKIGGKVSHISWRLNGKKVTPPKFARKGFSHF